MLITNGTIRTPGMRRRTIRKQVQFGPVSLRIATIVILGAAALIGLIQTTQYATKTYAESEALATYQEKDEELQALRDTATRLRSINEKDLNATPEGQPAASPSPAVKLEVPTQINALPNSPASYSQVASQPTL